MNQTASMLERKFSGLVAKIHRGDCVLVVGPRVLTPRDASPDGRSLPIDQYIALRLLQDLDSGGAQIMEPRSIVARYEREKGSSSCRSVVQDAISVLDGTSTQLHYNLASLPFRLVVCATADRMMVDAFQRHNKTPAWDCYNYCEHKRPPALPLPSAETPLVYNLFGCHDQPESMVLNDKNLLDYLVNITREDPKLPDAVRATLRAPSTVFLFVGFGFTNWWLRLLLKVLEVTGVENRGISLALEDRNSFSEAVYRENSGFFESLGIYIQARDDWDALAQELADRFRAQPAQTGGAAPPARTGNGASTPRANDAPLVFLSYASEDSEPVDNLGERLESHGIKVWVDRQGLRSGQNWENQIARVIGGVDGFIFVQTQNMDARDQDKGGVYNWELDAALHVAKSRSYGRTFVHHVTIGECRVHPHPALGRLHRVAIDTDAGIDRLAADILRSFSETRAEVQAASGTAR